MKRQNEPADKVRLRRGHHLGHYDRETVNAILDSGFLAHVGYVDDGAPLVTPMLYWRDGDYVYWHGATATTTAGGVGGSPAVAGAGGAGHPPRERYEGSGFRCASGGESSTSGPGWWLAAALVFVRRRRR